MSKLVVAGAWTIETNAEAGKDILGAQPVNSRLDYLREVLRAFDGFCREAARARAATDGVIFIFVAPEYYFKSTRVNVERSLSKAERQQIIAALTGLSRDYPHTVLIPGTIFWSKPADDKARKKAQTRLGQNINAYGTGNQLGQKWTALRARGGPDQVQYVSYNSAYVFYNGETYKYHKMSDASENLDADLRRNTLFIPGSRPGYFPDLGHTGVTFGIEICADHQAAVLNQTVDIHILSSAATTSVPANIRARPGGLFIHASSTTTEFLFNRGGTFEAPAKASMAFSATNFLDAGQLREQRETFLAGRIGDNRDRTPQSRIDMYNKVYNMAASHGRLDTWVTELN